MAPLLMPQLWDDRNIEPLLEDRRRGARAGCKLAIQLWHSGVRGFPVYKQETQFDLDATWYTLSPSQVPLGEFPGASTPKELSEDEIEEILDAYTAWPRRARSRPGATASSSISATATCRGSSSRRSTTSAPTAWGGSYENRLRFPVEALHRMRAAMGDEPFLGYRINSTSFWPGDLELEDIAEDRPGHRGGGRHRLRRTSPRACTTRSSTRRWSSSPAGRKAYARAIREVSSKPVLLVGRITTPDVAESLLAAGDGDAICLARQLFTDPDWALKAAEGRADDIRRCVAANYCWKSVSRGGRVQCVYNPELGREQAWGKGTLERAAEPKRALVIGAGPAGLEYARIAAARGHAVVVLEREADVGGHVRLESLLPSRRSTGLSRPGSPSQAEKNGAEIRTSSAGHGRLAGRAPRGGEARPRRRRDRLDVCRDGFQGWTAAPIPGWESGNCVGWDEVATGKAHGARRGDRARRPLHVVAPLTAVAIAENGASSVKLVTRWPMVGMETILDVYLDWILPKLYKAGVQMVCDHFVSRIDGRRVTLVQRPSRRGRAGARSRHDRDGDGPPVGERAPLAAARSAASASRRSATRSPRAGHTRRCTRATARHGSCEIERERVLDST